MVQANICYLCGAQWLGTIGFILNTLLHCIQNLMAPVQFDIGILQ